MREHSTSPEVVSSGSDNSSTPTPSAYASSSQTCSSANSPEILATPSWEKPRYIRSSSLALGKLRSLRSSENILLLTPVVPPPPTGPHTTDPFEPLGIALSRYHSRVRHAPFYPSPASSSIGLNDTYTTFIHQASTVIMVLCDPTTPRTSPHSLANCSTWSDRNDRASVIGQKAFQQAVRELTRYCRTPLIVIALARDPAKLSPSPSCDVELFGTSYHAATLATIAETLFDGTTSGSLELVNPEPGREVETKVKDELREEIDREEFARLSVDELFELEAA